MASLPAMASSKKQPRVVAVPLVGVGHATPMMHLCSYLNKEHGLPITFVAPEGVADLKGKIEERGTWPPPGSDIHLVHTHSSAPPEPLLFINGKVNITRVHYQARGNAAALEKLVKEIPEGVSTIISDYLSSWAMGVAEKLGIPGAMLFCGSATWSWFDMQLPDLVSEGLIPEKDELLTDEEDTIVHNNPLLRRSDIPWHFWNDKNFQDFTIKYNVGTWKKARWILVNTCSVLEEQMLSCMVRKFGAEKYLAVGPLSLENKERDSVGLDVLDRSCINWLDEQPSGSVLYIAFGSFASLSVDQVDEFVLGLESSQQPFLWVVRSPEGLSDTFEQFKERTKQRGMIVPWSPQLEILSHDAVGAFLTHCGWNSTIEGVSSGKPMLCWPCLFDQNINARFIVEEWKVGAWISRKGGFHFVDRVGVEQAIRMVMEGKEGKVMRQRAKELRSKVLEATVGSSKRLDEFAQQIAAIDTKERNDEVAL